MLTPRGVAVVAGAGVAWLAARVLGVDELVVVAVAAAALAALAVAYVRWTGPQIASRRLLSTRRVVAGDTVEVTTELRNDGAVASPVLLLSDRLSDGLLAAGGHATARAVVRSAPPRAVTALRWSVLATRRGLHHIGPITIRTRDPFALAERTQRYTTSDDVVVYPVIERLGRAAVRGSHVGSGSSDRRRLYAQGDEFHALREYVSGDDIRLVHWPSTARSETLMVRQQEQPYQPHATILLDTRNRAHATSAAFEKAVSAAASLVWHLADRDYALRLATDLPNRRVSTEDWQTLLDRLAVIDRSHAPSLGASVGALRGGEGLLAAVVGVSAREDEARLTVQALLSARGYNQRVALVCTTAEHADRATRMCALLRANRWQAALVEPQRPLTASWDDAVRPTRRSRRL